MSESPATPPAESLRDLLGGRRGALDASLPPAAFVIGWLAAHSIALASAGALFVGILVGIARLVLGHRITAVLASVATVAGAALIAARTGRAQDFFLIQLLSNAGSGLAWILSILIRWPLLGLVVGFLLGQRTRWRRDPDLLRAYSRASWIWVAQYTIRTVVFATLWSTGSVVALGITRIALSWPLVAATVAVSALVFARTLPPGHPGLRKPKTTHPSDPKPVDNTPEVDLHTPPRR